MPLNRRRAENTIAK